MSNATPTTNNHRSIASWGMLATILVLGTAILGWIGYLLGSGTNLQIQSVHVSHFINQRQPAIVEMLVGHQIETINLEEIGFDQKSGMLMAMIDGRSILCDDHLSSRVPYQIQVSGKSVQYRYPRKQADPAEYRQSDEIKRELEQDAATCRAKLALMKKQEAQWQ